MIRAFLLALLLHAALVALLLFTRGSDVPEPESAPPPPKPLEADVVEPEAVERALAELKAQEEAERAARARELKAWQERLQELQARYHEALEALEQQKERSRQSLTQLQQQIASTRESLKRLQEEREKLLLARQETLKALESLRHRREAVEGELQVLREKLQEIQTERHRIVAELEALRKQMDEVKGRHEGQLAELVAKERALKKALRTMLQEQLARSREEVSKIEQERLEATLQLAIDRIRRKVEGRWQRPLGYEGDLETLLEVTVDREGTVEQVRVVASSGDPLFDRSAIAAVYRASPLPLPEEERLREKLRRFKLRFRPEG